MLLDYFGIVRTVAYKYLGTFRREQKKQKRNLKMQIRNCLENHEIRVTCLEKRARSNVRMITTTRMSIKLRRIEKKKKKYVRTPRTRNVEAWWNLFKVSQIWLTSFLQGTRIVTLRFSNHLFRVILSPLRKLPPGTM